MEEREIQPQATEIATETTTEAVEKRAEKKPFRPRPRRPITLGEVLDPALIDRMYQVAGGRPKSKLDGNNKPSKNRRRNNRQNKPQG